MNKGCLFNWFNLVFVSVWSIIQLQALNLHPELTTKHGASLVKRDDFRSNSPSQASQEFSSRFNAHQDEDRYNGFDSSFSSNQQPIQPQEQGMEQKETIDPKWAQLLQEAKQKEEAFKNPVDTSNLSFLEFEAFQGHISKSDIVIIGKGDGYPIFADLTNGIEKIDRQHVFYKDYQNVVEECEKMTQKSSEEIESILKSSFVTIHPRNNTIFNVEKSPIYQLADSFHAIEFSYPHYQLYKKRFEENTVEWDKLWKEIADHEITYFPSKSIFDKRVRLIDYKLKGLWEGIDTPDDFDYPVLKRVFLQQEKEENQMRELLSKGVIIVPLNDDSKEGQDYEVPGFDINPIQPHHRIYSLVHYEYKKQQRKEYQDLNAEKLFEKLSIQFCYARKLTDLCVNGEQSFELYEDSDEYPFYFNVFLKSQQNKREQEKIEEIILHGIRERKLVKQGKTIFKDEYLNEVIVPEHPHYKFYIDAAKRQREQRELNKQNCYRDVIYCDFTISPNSNELIFVDRTKKKIIHSGSPNFSNYEKVWNQKQDDEALRDQLLKSETRIDMGLVPQKVGLPIIEVNFIKAEPGTLKWKIFREVFLTKRAQQRKAEEERERKVAESLSKPK